MEELHLVNTILTWQYNQGRQTLGQVFEKELQGITPGTHLIVDASQVGDIVLKRGERNSDKNLEELLNALKTNAAKNPFCLTEVSDYERWSRIASRLRMTVVSWREDQCKLVGRRIPEINDPTRLEHRIFFKVVASHRTLHVGDFKSLGVDEVQVVERLMQLIDVGLVVPVFPHGWTLAETNILLHMFRIEKAMDMGEMQRLFGTETVASALNRLGLRSLNQNYWYRNKQIRAVVGFAVVRP